MSFATIVPVFLLYIVVVNFLFVASIFPSFLFAYWNVNSISFLNIAYTVTPSVVIVSFVVCAVVAFLSVFHPTNVYPSFVAVTFVKSISVP